MSKPPARLQRVVFKTSRLLDFVGIRELTAQIGHDVTMWPLVVLKEELDNALDACEEAEIGPVILVEVSTEAGAAMISVTDNGPGLAPETVADILDFSTRASSREAYCSPTRGAQGNALKTIVAMPYALGDDCAKVQIESRGTWHRITFTADAVHQVPRISHETGPYDVKTGTSITVFWPDSACSYLEQRKGAFLQMCVGYAVLNPHLSLTARWDGELYVNLPASDDGWVKWRACDPTSPHWYTPQRLARYAAAHVARDQGSGRIRSVREFIAEFRGLSGSAKQKAVAEECGMARQPLAALFNDGRVNETSIAALIEAMQRHSRPVKPRDLGVIGRDHLLQFCTDTTVECVEETFRYRAITGETSDGIPFVVEAAFAAALDSDQDRRLVLGVNFASALGNPFRSLQGASYDGLETKLAHQRCDSCEPVVVILHLACARVEYQDRGKSTVVLDAAIGAMIVSAIETVTGAWAKQRKAEERDKSRRARRLDRLVAKPVRVSVKEAARQVMGAAYSKTSDNGRLPVKARQLMYSARPDILEMTGKDKLDDAYFTQTLLPDYIEAHSEECAGWDIVWDARGNFVEPHTGQRVPLGTLEVRRYLQLMTVRTEPAPITISTDGGYPTLGPEQRYDTILFVEKEGFYPLFERVQLAERFDLAITSTKGMSVTAARLLLDQLCERGVKRVLVLHDFDISGFSIFGTLGTSGRRYRFKNTVPLIDLGLRLNHVEAMGLQSEPVDVAGDWEKRAATLRQHGATADEIKFLRDRRVELNAMTSPQLVEFVEVQLALQGVTKLIPSDNILEKHARHLIEQRLARDALEQLRMDFAEKAKATELPGELRARLEARLAKDPREPWDVSLAAVISHAQGRDQ